MKQDPRYAVYWIPARSHRLWSKGCSWLGRDPELIGSAPSRSGTEAPRRYGFHATLSAPSRLRPGVDLTAWVNAVKTIAATTKPFEMPGLKVGTLGRFVAIRPDVEPDGTHDLRRLADRCVLELEAFRAPLDAAEFGRRSSNLDAEALRRLHLYGYQHVLEAWRFHLTLSNDFSEDPVGHALRSQMLRDASEHFAEALTLPLVANEIGIFVEPRPGDPFFLKARLPLGIESLTG